MVGSLFGGSLKISPRDFPDAASDAVLAPASGKALAVLAGGCFWCVEAVYRELDGVLEVVSGYSGGTAETADYEMVCTGRTEHAEVIQISYDPSRITFGRLLKIFFSVAHDPTQLNRQGNDIGTQYRSAIFHADDEQKPNAEAYNPQMDARGLFQVPNCPAPGRPEKLFSWRGGGFPRGALRRQGEGPALEAVPHRSGDTPRPRRTRSGAPGA